MNLSKVTGYRLLLSDLFFTLAVISGGYYIWLRGGGIFHQGIPGLISFLFESLIILSTCYYLFVYLQRDKKKAIIPELRTVAGSIDIFVIIENKNIEAVKATLESITNLDTNMPVYKLIICDGCGEEIEIFAEEYKCRVLKDDPKNPFNEEGISLAFLKSEAKYLLFVKSGTKLNRNFIRKTLPHFVDSNVCLVQGARKIAFEREVELKSILGLTAKIFSLLGSKSVKLDMLSDDSITYSQEYLSGKKFSLSEWNGVIIEKESFTKYLPQLEPEVEEDLSLFEDLIDDEGGLLSTSDDDDELPNQVSNVKTGENDEVLVDEDEFTGESFEGEETHDESGNGEEGEIDETDVENLGGDAENRDDENELVIDEETETEESETSNEDDQVEEEVEEPQDLELAETGNEFPEDGDESDNVDDTETEDAAVVDTQESSVLETEEEKEGIVENDETEEDEVEDDEEDDEEDLLDEHEDADILGAEPDKIVAEAKNVPLAGLSKDFELNLTVFTRRELKAILLPEQLIEKTVPSSIHERILFDINFFRKIAGAIKELKKLKSMGADKEVIGHLRGTFAGFVSQILVYFWGIYLILVTSLQIDVISENDFLLVLPAFLIFIISLEIRSSLIYGSEGFLTKVKRVILAPYYLGIIKIIKDEVSGEYHVETMAGYLRYLLLSLNFTAMLVTVIRIIYYYEPRLNVAILSILLFFFFVLLSSLLFFYTLSKKVEIEEE